MLQQSVLWFQVPTTPTRADLGWLTLLHAISLIASIYNSLPIGLRLLMGAAILVNLAIHIKQIQSDNPEHCEIELRNINQWSIRENNGKTHSASLLPSTVNTAWIVFLHLDVSSLGKRYLMIRRHQLDPETFRKLRVALRIAAASPDQ